MENSSNTNTNTTNTTNPIQIWLDWGFTREEAEKFEAKLVQDKEDRFALVLEYFQDWIKVH